MFDDELELRHRVITEPSGLPGLRGSKYLQSHIGPVFGELRGRLRRGQLSLFVGTPCQVAGLYAFLRKDYDHLVTLDLVCHGIASRRVFHKYLRHHEETAADTIVSVNFRDKRAGWKDFGVALRFASGREVVTPFRLDSFMRGFLQNLTLRPSCYGCLFNHVPRIADITLGDFWGIEDIDPRLDDDRGCSLVLLNGPKGQRLFEDTKQRLVVREFALGDAVRKNPHIVSSAKAPRNAAQFYADLETEPFARVIQQYLGQRTRVARITSAVGRTVRRGLRGFMRS
jgi:coenzyme F420-reducing hydrogenase beta subunit